MTLAEFLLARIAEDEAGADTRHDTSEDDLRLLEEFGDCSCGYPARVLAECEAKRAIVALHTRTEPAEHECAGDFTGYSLTDPELSPCPTLLLMAMPFADHPDFQEAWRPEAPQSLPLPPERVPVDIDWAVIPAGTYETGTLYEMPRLISPPEGATIERREVRVRRWPRRWSRSTWF